MLPCLASARRVQTIRPGADGGVLRDLEITGGHYYGAQPRRAAPAPLQSPMPLAPCLA